MKIVHLVMTGGYSAAWAYQDSILVRYHARQHDVSVITTQYERTCAGMEKTEKSQYVNEYGVKVYRLKNWTDALPGRLRGLRIYRGIYRILDDIRPDIIFSHNVQYIGFGDLAKYVKKHPGTRLFADNHVDWMNVGQDWVSLRIIHGGLWRFVARRSQAYVSRFYGVTAQRVEFLKKVYGLRPEKLAYLPLGAEDDLAAQAKSDRSYETVRREYGIKESDFLLVTGGKIDRYKPQTLDLMRAMADLPERVRLIVFGSVQDGMREDFLRLVDGKRIQFAGWVDVPGTYAFVEAADLMVFPGGHSVLWEQTVGQGKPLVCNEWGGMRQLDLGGNVRFLQKADCEELREVLLSITGDEGACEAMKRAALTGGQSRFLYGQIAKESIDP